MFFGLIVLALFASSTVHGHRQTYVPNYKPITQKYLNNAPDCAKNTTNTWCVTDTSYPHREVQQALYYHHKSLQAFYKDVIINTILSIDQSNGISEETYLCPSTFAYVQPLRAVNTDGKWRVIVNHVESYGHKYTQSTRVEMCDSNIGTRCPLVSGCYESKCIQKEVIHRFLVYDPNYYDFPFVVETFKFPSACACAVGAFFIDNQH